MDSNFFRHWFSGFEAALADMSEDDRERVFKQCGRACSDSLTKRIYIEEYSRSKNADDFLSRLKQRFPEINYTVIREDAVLELTYRFCACDLVSGGYMKTPLLCGCSRQSLLYNWEAVLGEGKVKIELLESILCGSDSCRFRIYLLR